MITRGSRLIAILVIFSACAGAPKREPVAAEQRSNFTLTTGNGFGFTLFDAKSGTVTAMLDHPYRSLHAPKDRRQNGPERRNLLQEFSLDGVEVGEASYLEQTNIVANLSPHAKRYVFSPFGVNANAFVALLQSDSTNASVVRLRFNLGASPTGNRFWQSPFNVAALPGGRIVKRQAVWTQTGRGRGTMIYIPLTRMTGHCEPKCQANDVTLVLEGARQNSWSGVLVAYVEDPKQVGPTIRTLQKWLGERPPATVLADSVQEWRDWRKPSPVTLKSEAETKLWRQSEAVLRMAQVLEPGRGYGQILASLAPGEWSIAWVRDGSYATVALARSGHFTEAKRALDFFLNAEPVGLFKKYVGGVDYRVSLTRYYGDGEEEADYSEQPAPNVELDNWGLTLWAARQYVDAAGDRTWLASPTRKGSVYEVLRDGVAEPLAKQIETDPRIVRPDSSIWEVHQSSAKHFLFSSLMAARGFCDFAWVAETHGQLEDAKRFVQFAKEVRYDLPLAFRAPEGYLLGAIERSPATDLDAATIELFSMAVLDDTATAKRTFKHLNKLFLETGGYKRNGGTADYEINEWVFVDYRMASAFFKRGDREAGEALIDRLTQRASQNFYLLPEEFVASVKDRPVGAFMGSYPMVGYGAGVQMLTVLDREGSREPHACGSAAEPPVK